MLQREISVIRKKKKLLVENHKDKRNNVEGSRRTNNLVTPKHPS